MSIYIGRESEREVHVYPPYLCTAPMFPVCPHVSEMSYVFRLHAILHCHTCSCARHKFLSSYGLVMPSYSLPYAALVLYHSNVPHSLAPTFTA